MTKEAQSIGKVSRKGSPAVGSKAVTKVSVSLGASALVEAKVAAKKRRLSLSAYMTEALERDQRRLALAEFIADFESRFGVITEKEVAEAKAKWQG